MLIMIISMETKIEGDIDHYEGIIKKSKFQFDSSCKRPVSSFCRTNFFEINS